MCRRDARTTRPKLCQPSLCPQRQRRRSGAAGAGAAGGPVALVILALVIFVPLLTCAYYAYTTGNTRAEAEAEAAKDDPNWKLVDIESNRKKMPDQENSALHIMATNSSAGGLAVGGVGNYDQIFAKLRPTAQLNTQQVQFIRGQLAKNPKALAEARKLKDMPYGRFRSPTSDDFVTHR